MRSRKREAIFMGIGILAGLALSGPAAQAADYLTARPTTQTFYINGQQVPLTAYLIGGSNYVRLRDIGRAVDFGVTYDATTNSVYIAPRWSSMISCTWSIPYGTIRCRCPSVLF